jgi:hypothetical protein
MIQFLRHFREITQTARREQRSFSRATPVVFCYAPSTTVFAMPKLTVTTLGFGNQSCELPDGQFTVGRAARNLIVIDDASVSTEHCELLINGAEVAVRDVGSRNGTFVNETPVQSISLARNGQTIRVGRVDLLVETPESKTPSLPPESVTAMYFRTAARPVSPAGGTHFPIIFTPVGAVSEGNQTFVFPKAALKDAPPPEPEPAAPASSPDPAANPVSKLWILLAVLSLLVVAGLWVYFNWGL